MDLLVTLCRDVSADQGWVDDIILSTNLQLANIEMHGASHFTECKYHVREDVVQIKLS